MMHTHFCIYIVLGSKFYPQFLPQMAFVVFTLYNTAALGQLFFFHMALIRKVSIHYWYSFSKYDHIHVNNSSV